MMTSSDHDENSGINDDHQTWDEDEDDNDTASTPKIITSLSSTKQSLMNTFAPRSQTEDQSGSSNSYDMTYAMKSIHISRCTDPTFVEELQNEIQILKALDHPHIERVLETFEYDSQIFVILELCSGGDLYRRDPYTEDEAARITSSILSAIAYMHSKNVYVKGILYFVCCGLFVVSMVIVRHWHQCS